MTNKKLILVTGGAGFIGSHLCARLVKDGHKVISLDNYFTGSRENHVAGVEYRDGHTKDIEKHIPEKPDVIYHLGEYSRVEKSLEEPAFVWDLNKDGTFGVLEFWRKRGDKLVYAGSSTKFGDGGLGRMQSPYAWTKASNTELIRNYSTWYNLPHAITYFYNVYGPRERAGSYGTVIEIFRQKYLAGEPLAVNSPGTQKRNFTHVDDIVDGLTLVSADGTGDDFGIGDEQSYSILEVAQMFGGKIVIKPATRGNRMTADIDTSKMRSLGWSPKKNLADYIKESQKEMKRVLIFSLAYYPHVGGAEIAIKEITDRIFDVEFHLVTLNFGGLPAGRQGNPEEEKIGNVFVHRVGNNASYLSKILFVPRAAFAARALNRIHRFDAFWAMMSYMLFPIVLLRWFGIQVPYLLTLQEGDPFSHTFNRWFILPFRSLLKTGFKNASAVQAISTYLAHWARRVGYQGEVQVIPNGVDIANFQSIQHVQHRVLDTVTLVTTSRLVHKNAVDDVIRALKFLPENVHFRIYGSGVEEVKLKKLAQEIGIESRVEFMGHINHSELPRALAEADIFIRPSRSEGMGNSFIEAMAVGLPVIATQEGGIADFLFDEKRNPDKETTGWAVDKDSPEQIAQAVKEILQNPEQVARVKATAKKMVIEKYDWNMIAKDMLEKVFGPVLTK